MAGSKLDGFWLDLGMTPYGPAFVVQERVLRARIEGGLPPTVILQENRPVFTIGRSGSAGNILAGAEELGRRGIEVLEVNRGGDVTYHGPGQLVVSPLLDLDALGLNAHQYMHRLEEVLMDLLATYGIAAGVKEGYPGVWRPEGKIAAVGIAVKQGVTFHGFSLNVDPDLSAFGLINPCGVRRMPVTSLRAVLGWTPAMADVKSRLRKILETHFGLRAESVSWEALEQRLAA